MAEGVPEVEDLAAPLPLERILEADPGLERGARADHLLLRELPERTADEQTRLDDLGHPIPALFLGERREQLGVDHHLFGIVKGTDQVLALGEIDRSLAADRGVHLADERR